MKLKSQYFKMWYSSIFSFFSPLLNSKAALDSKKQKSTFLVFFCQKKNIVFKYMLWRTSTIVSLQLHTKLPLEFWVLKVPLVGRNRVCASSLWEWILHPNRYRAVTCNGILHTSAISVHVSRLTAIHLLPCWRDKPALLKNTLLLNQSWKIFGKVPVYR